MFINKCICMPVCTGTCMDPTNDMVFTRLVDLSSECMNRIGSQIRNTTNIRLMLCGDKTFSAKWAGSFTGFYCYPSAWRRHAIAKRLRSGKGRKIETVCLFVMLRTLNLQGKYGDKALNRKEIELLPPSLTNLNMEIKKNTCDSKFPPNLTSLTLLKVPADFDPLYPLPLGIIHLRLMYERTGTNFPTVLVPKHLMALKGLSELYLCLPDGISDRRGISQIPPSVTYLNLGRGGFAEQDSIAAVGQMLTNLQSLECESVFPNWYRHPVDNYDTSVLPQSLTRLPFCFGRAPTKRSVSQAEIAAGFYNWPHYPRNLRSFESDTGFNTPGSGCDRHIAVRHDVVYGGGAANVPGCTNVFSMRVIGQGRINATHRGDPTNEHLMDHIPPMLESITLCGVVLSCPLRFVTHLNLRSTYESGYTIKQSQIEACQYMSSVTHLVIYGCLEKINDLSICSWRLRSLKVNEKYVNDNFEVVVGPLYFNDFLPWMTPDLKELVMCCGDLLGTEGIEIPTTLEIVRLKVWRKVEDSEAPASLREFITFVER